MASRRMLALAIFVLCACSKDEHHDKAPAKGEPATKQAIDLAAHCEPLAQACGDTDKHIAKILDECTATAKQADQRCAAEAAAVYDCYAQQLCGGDDKVWALDDLRVLADRHDKCATEREALRGCAAK